MTTAILKNGIATAAGEITVFNFNSETGEYLGSNTEYLPVGVGLPAFSTDMQVPDASDGHVAVYENAAWTLKPDLRDTVVYSIADRTKSTVDYIGPVKNGFVTIAPGSVFDEWNGSAWVLNETAKLASEVQTAERQRQQLLVLADEVTADWRTELALGDISDADKTKLSAWMAYKRAVKAVDATKPIWPAKPE